MAREGWIGVTIDSRHGGMGLDHVARVIIIEEVSRVSAAMGAALQASILGTAKIIHFGDRVQQETWLPLIARGDCLPTIAVTEPESGGNVLGMSTSAVRDGGDYIVNGRKVFVGNAHVGDLHGVVARTGGPGSQALSAFLVEATSPGVHLLPHSAALGLHGFSFGEIVFTDCRVPAVNRLGAEGDGLAVAYSSSIVYGRLNLAAVALGLHRAVLEETTAYASTRHRNGQPLADLGVITDRIGWIKSRVMTAELVLYQAAHLLDVGAPCDAELMNANLVGVETLLHSADAAMKIHAACGLFPDRPIERHWRDAQHLWAPAGTSDIQLRRLCAFALGREHRHWSERMAASATRRNSEGVDPSSAVLVQADGKPEAAS
jgi:alkylation response protein AidB-like acyl-CoA dehydrogenase